MTVFWRLFNDTDLFPQLRLVQVIAVLLYTICVGFNAKGIERPVRNRIIGYLSM